MSENINHKQIHWFPGHMMKTLRVMQDSVRQVDAVLILLDARIPHSSLNPEIERMRAQSRGCMCSTRPTSPTRRSRRAGRAISARRAAAAWPSPQRTAAA